jgi:hypothetical protein
VSNIHTSFFLDIQPNVELKSPEEQPVPAGNITFPHWKPIFTENTKERGVLLLWL